MHLVYKHCVLTQKTQGDMFIKALHLLSHKAELQRVPYLNYMKAAFFLIYCCEPIAWLHHFSSM